MSSESEGQDRPADIDTIKQLLRKLEEAALRDSEAAGDAAVAYPPIEDLHEPARALGLETAFDTPSELAAQPDGTALSTALPVPAGSSPTFETGSEIIVQPLPVTAAELITTSPTPGGELLSLRRGQPRTSASIDDVLSQARSAIEMPDFPKPAAASPPTGSSKGSRIAIAAGSFALGIAAAGALLVAFDRMRSPRTADVASIPVPVGQPMTPAPKIAVEPIEQATPPKSDAGAAPEGGTTARTDVREATAQAGSEAPSPAATSTIEPSSAAVASSGPSAESARSIAGAGKVPPAAGSTSEAPEAKPSANVTAPATAGPPLVEAKPAPENGTRLTSPTAKPDPIAPAPAAQHTLRVPDQFELRAGQRLQLGLGLAPAVSEKDRLLVVFRQVPPWLSMSKGGAIGNSIWLLPAHQIADVWLESSDASPNDSADVVVQLARIDGGIIAERTIKVRVRARQPLGTQTIVAASPLEQAVIVQLQARGELLLDTGEVEAARTLLRTAAEAGSVAAALRLAETYDPGEVQRLGVTAISADPAEAVRWYERAQALGSPIATARLMSLGRR